MLFRSARYVTAHILRSANDPRRAAANASNYLMLMGSLCGGWMIVQSAAAASRLADDNSTDNMRSKIVLAEIYITHHLPQVTALGKTILDGDMPVLSMATDWL